MLEGIEANKWIKSSGYSYVTEINPIVHWIIDYNMIQLSDIRPARRSAAAPGHFIQYKFQ